MFFPRLRRQARWAFALLVLVFAGGFVFLGVGSGSSGIGDLLQGNFGGIFGGGSSGPSIGKAQDRVAKHPRDPEAYRALANAYVAKQRTAEAIGALRQYVALRPKDVSALEELASLELNRAGRIQNQAYAAYQDVLAADPGQLVRPPASTKLGQALGPDPISRAASDAAQARYNRLASESQSAYTDAVSTYKQLAARQPDSTTTQLELGIAAQRAGDTQTALTAFKRYLKLAPDASDAPAVRQAVAQLQAQAGLSLGGGGG
jgi:tetratricopeptide (TPR) repeat protein